MLHLRLDTEEKAELLNLDNKLMKRWGQENTKNSLIKMALGNEHLGIIKTWGGGGTFEGKRDGKTQSSAMY